MKFIPRLVLLIVLSFLLTGQVESQEKGTFRDSVDNAFDISKFLLDLHGFLPLISPITEPALGYGLVAAGVYFVPKEKSSHEEFKMPDIVGLAVGYTQNGSWFGGGAYMGFWKDNSIRYRGILGYGSINMQYFGSGDNFLAENPASFSIESVFLFQQALFRIGESKFMIGGNYILNITEVTAFEENKLPNVDSRDFNLVNSGITLIGEFETLNNILSPTRGTRINLSYRNYFEFLGSDRHIQQLSFFSHFYLPVVDRWVAGLRLESILASNNTPFYMLPYISLRGVPLLRYQGELTLLAETEQYFNVYKRWGLLGFAGYGRTISDLESMSWGSEAWNAGAGFRYLLARKLGLKMGIDVARGPENWAFYIVFGSSWLK